MRQIERDVTDFLVWLEDNGKRANTVAGHRDTLRQFLMHCHAENPGELSPDHIRQFRGILRKAELKPRSQNEYRLRILGFLNWCHASQRYDIDVNRLMFDWQFIKPEPVDPAKKERLTDDVYEKAVELARQRGAYLPLYVTLNAELGLDGSTCARIMRGDVDMVAGTIHYRRTKTGEPTTIAMTETVKQEMELWLREYDHVITGLPYADCYLLPRRYFMPFPGGGGRWEYSPETYMSTKPGSVLSELYREAGATGEKIGSRAGRRFAADTIQAEAKAAGLDPLAAAQGLLQHREASTTVGYLGVNPLAKLRDTLLRRRGRRTGLRRLRRVA